MPVMPQHTLPIGEPHLINEIYNPHIDLPLLRESLKRTVEDGPGKAQGVQELTMERRGIGCPIAS